MKKPPYRSILLALSALTLHACKNAGDTAFNLIFTAVIWTSLPFLCIAQLPFLPLALVDSLKKTPPGPTAVAYLPEGDQLIVAHREGKFQYLARMSVADLSTVPLTTGERFDLDPQVSPDGRRILFASATKASKSKANLRLWIQSIDGTNLTQLTGGTNSDASPRFSPDGTKVVYASSANGQEADIFLIDARGGIPRRLTSGPDNDFYPMFLPDGERILFARATEFGSDVGISTSNWHHWDWYTVRTDGTGLTRLTTGTYYDVVSPEPSPDGTRVLFFTDTGFMGDNARLLVLDDSPRAEELRPRGSRYTVERNGEPHGRQLRSLRFDATGNGVLFTMEEETVTGTVSEVHRMDLKTGEAHPLTKLDAYVREVECSPRGDSLALLVEVGKRGKRDTKTELWLVDGNGANPRRADFASGVTPNSHSGD